MDYDGAGIQTCGTRAAAAAVTQASASSLALAFDEGSSNGADILLQTREWFPPARALATLAAFRKTHLAFAAASHKQQSSTVGPHPAPDDLDSALGRDPLAASSGQVIVDVESKYCIITISSTPSTSSSSPPWTATPIAAAPTTSSSASTPSIRLSASSSLPATAATSLRRSSTACKYPEIYMALDIVLRGIGSVRLATILSSIHGDNIAKMVHTAIDAEIRVHSADTWSSGAEALSLKRCGNLNTFSKAFLELSPETLAVGDEVTATIAPVAASLPTNEQ